MPFFHVYIFLHIFFMIGIIVLCAAVGMPTRYWVVLGGRIRAHFLYAKGRKLKKALQLQDIHFSSDESFLDRGVGLAIDHQRGLMFLAQPEGSHYQTAILPKAQIGAHTTIINQVEGFHRCYLEVLENGANAKKWRLPCADLDLADEINDKLTQFTSLTAG